jgi:hypothetical protein
MYNIGCKENLALTFVRIRRAEIPCTYFAMTMDFVLTMRMRNLEVMDIFFSSRWLGGEYQGLMQGSSCKETGI